MCIAPNKLSDGKSVACRKCWQCLEHKIDDWVGRCIAESKVSVSSAFITLTYAPNPDKSDHERARVLTYSDVQNFFKRMRKVGIEVRYFAVGEQGSYKGRAHWHVIAFFQNAIPEGFWDYGRNAWHPEKRKVPIFVRTEWNVIKFNCPLWPYGFSHWTPVQKGHTKGSIRYACKYIHKDVNDEAAQSKLAMSKAPPIGARYFEQLAQMYVDEGVAPPDGFYMFPNEARRKKGEIIRFRLSGKSADLFCQAFLDKWKAQRGGHPPWSQYLEDYEDRMCSADAEMEAREVEKRVRPERRWPFNPPLGYKDADIHCKGEYHVVSTENGELFYTGNKEGKFAWRIEPGIPWTEGGTQRKLAAALRYHQTEGVKRPAFRVLVLIQSLRREARLSRAGGVWKQLQLSIGRYERARMSNSEGKWLWLRSSKQIDKRLLLVRLKQEISTMRRWRA